MRPEKESFTYNVGEADEDEDFPDAKVHSNQTKPNETRIPLPPS